MKIGTPVATMGIRGTTGVVEEEVATVSATQNGVTYSFSVVADFGTGVAGLFDLIDQAGNVIATVSQTGYVTYLTPQGVGNRRRCRSRRSAMRNSPSSRISCSSCSRR
jgi:hypothetical protein